jgi:pimeloyl-ACP methyl ester carboxylesterase
MDSEAAPSRAAQTLRLADGGVLGYAEFGDPGGAPVFALHGTPVSRLIYAFADQPARARGLRLIAPDRPGYGLSTPSPGRRIVDHVADVTALADHLGVGEFAVAGLSGGGPFAVACAHGLPDRVRLAALLAPVGPLAEREDWGMSPLQRLVYGAAARSEPVSRLMFAGLRRLCLRAPDLAYGVLQRRVALPDKAVLAKPEVRAALMDSLADGLREGPDGAARDLHLFSQPWGFALSDVLAPCIVWQGTDDRTVPPGATYHLAERLPVCRLDRIPGVGHFWLFDNVDRVLDALEAAMKT